MEGWWSRKEGLAGLAFAMPASVVLFPGEPLPTFTYLPGYATWLRYLATLPGCLLYYVQPPQLDWL
jgi:hypothetical protein